MFDNKLDNVASILKIFHSWAPQMVVIVLNGLLALMAALLQSISQFNQEILPHCCSFDLSHMED